MWEFVARTKQTRSTLLQTCLCGSLWLVQKNQIYFAADLFMCEFVARTKQTRSTLLQTCLCVSLWLVQNKADLLCYRLVNGWVCGSCKTNQIYFATDLLMCEFVARTKQTRSTLLQTCLFVSLWLAQNKPDLLCYRLVYVWVCGSYKTNEIYFAADLFICEFVARTKQTRSTFLQTCLCGSLWLAQNKPDLLCCRPFKCVSLWLAQNKQDLFCCRLVYVWVCGSHKTNKVYFATDLFMCEFVARTKQTRSTLLQTCLCVSLWLAQNKPDLLCCRLVYVWVCGSYKTNQIYIAADLFMCEFVARTKQTRSTLLQTCLCGCLWLAQNKPDLLCCRLVYVWVCGSHKTNQIYFAADLFLWEFVARTK